MCPFTEVYGIDTHFRSTSGIVAIILSYNSVFPAGGLIGFLPIIAFTLFSLCRVPIQGQISL